MLLFDFLIGNSDRHQSNWALLVKISTEMIRIRWSPLYDNGSSLCCYINDIQLPELLGKDKNRFNALVDSKSRARIRINGKIEKKATHKEVAEYLLKNYSIAQIIAQKFVEKLTNDRITSLIGEYSDDVLCKERKELIRRFLNKKIEILTDLLKEVELNGTE
jgi:hypothetical protein